MVTVLEIIRRLFLIISVTHMSGLISLIRCANNDNMSDAEFMETCKQQNTYFLTDQQSLKVEFYYDAGGLEPDSTYIRSMCKARRLMKHVTFSFYVGITVTRDKDGTLICENTDKNNKDCGYSLLDACASQLLPDFGAYLCCTYESSSETMTVGQCFQQQSDKLDEFEKCVDLKDPKIRPDEILLQNAKNALATFPEGCWPFLAFNGQYDKCAQFTFRDDPLKVICAMLAAGKEKKCNN